MGDLLGSIGVVEWGAGGLLALLVLSWILGLQPTRGQMHDLRQQLASKDAEIEYLRRAVDAEHGANLKNGMALERLLALAEAGNHVMTELQAARHWREGDPR